MLTLTENAIDKVKDYAVSNEKYKGKSLRIFVQGGGCSGFQYGFAFDDKRDGDEVVVGSDEVSVLIDQQSAPHLQGVKVDYVEDIRGSGFVVENPNATGGCGCGSSFSTDASASPTTSASGCGTGGCG